MVHVCMTCGTSYAPVAAMRERCEICSDERQYVPPSGQKWTTRPEIAARYSNCWRELMPGLFSITTTPSFGIGQRAIFIMTPNGNILWDCIANLDQATEAIIKALGGISIIAISHPHYYTTMQDWSETFEAPIYVHKNDQKWVMRHHDDINYWTGDTICLSSDIQLINLGGHFAGGAVLLWKSHDGVLLVGDILQITPGRDRVSFMWSYPNLLPLPAETVEEIARRVDQHKFCRMYGAFEGQEITANAKIIVARSAKLYTSMLTRRMHNDCD